MKRIIMIGMLTCLMAGIMTVAWCEQAAETSDKEAIFLPDPPMPGEIEFINPNPPEFKTPDYPGKYYDTVVPATLDLAERARMAAHAVTSMTNPNLFYEQYFTVTHMSQPPAMDHNASDMHGHGKFMEVLPLMRMMSGSMENMEVERAWMDVTLKMQGPDGLIYVPTTGRTWILPPNMDVASGSPGYDTFEGKHFCLLGYSTARSLAALLMYAQKDPEGPWAEAAEKLAKGYEKVLLEEGDNAYLFSTWMTPGRKIEKQEKHPFNEFAYLAGAQAWISQYLSMYDRAADYPRASELGEKMMNYNMNVIEYNEPSGRFKHSKGVGAGEMKGHYAHFHTHAMNILACLYAHMQQDNEALLDRAVKAYEYGVSQGNRTLGFFPMVTYDKYVGAQTAETCQVADMVVAAVTLSKLGVDRWEDADRWTRNQLAENQLTQIGWLTDGHIDYSRSETPAGFFDNPGQRTTDRVPERTLGAFAGWPTPNDWVGAEDWWGGDTHRIFYTIMNCCTGSGCRALYSVWRDMIAFEDGKLTVNLLFNRASQWADIDSYIPYTGRVDFKIKKKIDLAARLPEWVDLDAVKVSINNKDIEPIFEGRYAQIGKLKKGQVVTMTFPIAERTEKFNIEGFDYTFVIRGNDVVSVDPPGKYYPMYQRGHYRQGAPMYRKVTRFVSDEPDFTWW